MIDLNQQEAAALLALISWQAEDGAALPRDDRRDADLRSAARKLERPAPATKAVQAARRKHDSASEERTLMLAWIARHLLPKNTAHLSIALADDGLNELPIVVCVHTKRGPMAWRITELEATAYFGQLFTHNCEHGAVKRSDKMRILADFASQ